MVSTSGAQLLPEDAVQTLLEELLPRTTILTPNLPEAKLLLKHADGACDDPKTVDDIIKMAQALQKLGPKYVLLKGGHLPLTRDRVVSTEEADRHMVFNVLYGEGQTVTLEGEYLRSKNTHGTGCSLACRWRPDILRRFSRLTGWYSGNRVEPSQRHEHGSGCQSREPLCRSGDQNKCRLGSWQWSHKPLPLHLHVAFRPVSAAREVAL